MFFICSLFAFLRRCPFWLFLVCFRGVSDLRFVRCVCASFLRVSRVFMQNNIADFAEQKVHLHNFLLKFKAGFLRIQKHELRVTKIKNAVYPDVCAW